jgi:isoquinoline 1-oxidoreductase subunit alpha
MPSYNLSINDQRTTVTADEDTPLLWVLRENLKLTGTKYGCGVGACGACTVHLDGVAARSCQLAVGDLGDSKIVTIEAIGATAEGRAVQNAWVEADVAQCGYCQSGQIMTAAALLIDQPKPDDTDIETAMGFNLCRCGTYQRIRHAITSASEKL